MNLFSRSSQPVPHVPVEKPVVHEPPPPEVQLPPKTAGLMLEALLAEDMYPQYSAIADREGENEAGGDTGVGVRKNESSSIAKHQDVSDEEGWIAIPYSEQVYVLALLSACKQDAEIITPFKLAAAMSKNGLKQSPTKQDRKADDGNAALLTKEESSSDSQGTNQNGETLSNEMADPQKDIFAYRCSPRKRKLRAITT